MLTLVYYYVKGIKCLCLAYYKEGVWMGFRAGVELVGVVMVRHRSDQAQQNVMTSVQGLHYFP